MSRVRRVVTPKRALIGAATFCAGSWIIGRRVDESAREKVRNDKTIYKAANALVAGNWSPLLSTKIAGNDMRDWLLRQKDVRTVKESHGEPYVYHTRHIPRMFRSRMFYCYGAEKAFPTHVWHVHHEIIPGWFTDEHRIRVFQSSTTVQM